MNSGSFAAHLRNKWWYRRCVCHARWWDAEPPAGRRGGGSARGDVEGSAARGCNTGFRKRRRTEGWMRWKRKGSDVLPVSIIIGGWLTGRRFAPHNSRRPIILPRLPCTNSYITCRHVLPHRYIITRIATHHHTFSSNYRGLRKTARTRAVRIANMTIMRVRLPVRANPPHKLVERN